MPSVYHSCTLDDAATEALGAMKNYLENEVRQQFNDQLATVETALNDLVGDPTFAATTIGTTTENKIVWTAVESGSNGNQINIQYVYLGPVVNPVTLVTELRLPSALVDGNAITLYLACSAAGVQTSPSSAELVFWNADPAVATLVQGTTVGAGTDINEASPAQYLEDGKDRAMTQTENAANAVAKVFGQNDYKEFLRAVDIPVIESAADAAQYIQTGDEYAVVNSKLLIIDGTNLVGINKIYEKTGNDLDKTKEILAAMTAAIPNMMTTQNTTRRTYEFICGENQAVDTITEQYRNLDTNVNTTVAVNGGDLASLHHYVFWPEEVKTSRAAYGRLETWGMPEEYIGEILSGESPGQEDYLDVQAPEVYRVDDIELLDDLLFTDAELEELLQLQLPGVKVPHKLPMDDRVDALTNVLTRKPAVQDNGTTNKVKSPLVTMQAVDVAALTDDQNLSKELSARGKACARSADRLAPENVGGFNTPNLNDLDLPDLPFDQLPDPAKKIESAYGALSSTISFANRIFDLMIGSLTKTVEGILNKIQNASSMVDNMFGNSLAQCLLGTTGAGTGLPEYPGVGDLGSTGNALPDISSVTGGLPIPLDILKESFKKLSISLDETITEAFGAVMKTIQIPLCIVQKLLSSLSGFDLGGLLNPCKDGAKPDDSCPPEAVQEVIDASEALTGALDTIPSLADNPTTLPVEEVTETVQNFTGSVQKTVTSTTETVTRGIQEVMDDLGKSVDSKIELVEQFDKAIKDLFGDAQDTKETIDEEAETNTGCFPSPLGMLTDAIEDFIG